MLPRIAALALLAACRPTIQGGSRHAVGAGEDSGASDTAAPESGPPDSAAPASARCGLSLSAEETHGVEGDRLHLSVHCDDSPEALAEVAVLGLPPGAEWDPTVGRIDWQTDGASAGTWPLTLSAPAGQPGALPQTAVVKLVVVDDPDAPGATPPDPERYVEEWGLPVIHIAPEGPLTPAKVPARLVVAGEAFDGSAKLRGATSLAYPKNSLTLDFEGEEAELPGWGSQSRGHMVLTSLFDDNSYVRQKLVFDTWAAMAASSGADRLTPRTTFAVVYLDGEYHGLYLASDRIDDEFTRHMGHSGHGELFKAVSHDANYALVDEDGAPKDDLADGWEKKEGDDLEDLSSLRALTGFFGAATATQAAAEGGDWVDLDEYIDWWILVTWTLAEDSAGKNHYVYRDAPGAPFRFVPWDFNASYGQSWKTKRYDADLVRDHTRDNRVFALLWEDPGLRARAVARLAALTAPGGPLTADWQLSRLDALIATLGPAIERDEARWGEEYRSFGRWKELRDSREDWTDAAGERAYVAAWIASRAEGMADWPATLP